MNIERNTLAAAKSAFKGIVSVGINKITSQNNILTFTMNDGTTTSVTLTGLSDNNYTNDDKNKLSSLNSNILTLFTYVNNQLLFNGQSVINDTLDLSEFAKTTDVNIGLSNKANILHTQDISTINNLQTELDNRYIKTETMSITEIQTLVNSVVKNMTWKDSVTTIDDLIALTNITTGETRVVTGTSTIYTYNGTSWVNLGSSANIPLVTTTNDGQMSKEDKTKLDSIIVANLVTNTQLSNLLSLKADSSSIPTMTSQITNDSDFATNTQINTKLIDYAKLTDLSNRLVAGNIKQGSNITITTSGNDITISASGNGSGSSINDDAETTSTIETYSVNKIQSLITEVNNTNFTNANEAKTLTINAIGDSSLATTNTFTEISNSILSKKQNIVNALTSKGITATQSDDLESYADKINSIVQNSQIKNTKLNKTAGSTYQVILTNPTTIENVCTNVLEYQVGTTGVVQYDCGFNNSDSTSFNTTTDKHIVFDGTMHQDNNIQNITMTNEGTIDTYTVYSSTIDKTQFYKINNITEATVSTNEVLIVNGTYNPTLVQANSDINLVGIDRISNIVWTATNTTLSSSKLLLLYSLDSGVTWNGYDVVNHLVLNISDINSLSEIQSKGISITNINSLTQTDLDNIRSGSIKIRFAYYYEKNSYTDTLTNDEIVLKVDMTGNDMFSTHYSVAFDGSKTITYTFTANGTYTIVYTDNN